MDSPPHVYTNIIKAVENVQHLKDYNDRTAVKGPNAVTRRQCQFVTNGDQVYEDIVICRDVVGYYLPPDAPVTIEVTWSLGVIEDYDPPPTFTLRPGQFCYAIDDKFILPLSGIPTKTLRVAVKTHCAINPKYSGLELVLTQVDWSCTDITTPRGAYAETNTCRKGYGLHFNNMTVRYGPIVGNALNLPDMRKVASQEQVSTTTANGHETSEELLNKILHILVKIQTKLDAC